MRIVITGGTGLIGRALAAELAGSSRETILLSRSSAQAAGLPPGVRVERWDGKSAMGWAPLVDGAKAVVHLAGENIATGRWTTEKKRRIRDSRLRSSEAVATAIEQASVKPSVLLQGSAVGYYGAGADQEITEDSPPGKDFLAQVCDAWEASTAIVEALGVRRVVLRTGVVLSGQGGALPRMLLPFRMFAGGPLGDGRQWLPWIHIADEVAAIRFLLENDETAGPYNLTAPRPLTNAEFSRALGGVLNRPSSLPAPGLALRLLLGEMSSLLLEGQRAVPQRLLDAGFRFKFPDAEAALRDLLA